jgi:hypothetical protein
MGWGRHRGSSLKPAFFLSGPKSLCNTSVVPNIVNKVCSAFISLIMQYVLYLRISTRVTDLQNSYILHSFIGICCGDQKPQECQHRMLSTKMGAFRLSLQQEPIWCTMVLLHFKLLSMEKDSLLIHRQFQTTIFQVLTYPAFGG